MTRMPNAWQVLVLRLKTSGTVEERIIDVASDKRSMADRSITGTYATGQCSRSHEGCTASLSRVAW